ncbi:MAG: hypothetical protein ACLQOO_08560 [Terriglobia bacterium]
MKASQASWRATVMLAAALTAAPAAQQAPEPRHLPTTRLTAGHLADAGVPLPSYLTGDCPEETNLGRSAKGELIWMDVCGVTAIRDLERYQAKLPSHQELMVEWDSLPGVQGRPELRGALPLKEVEQIPLSPNFVLKDRKRNVRGGPVTWSGALGLVIVGVTSGGEVRGLETLNDPRIWWSDSLGPGGTMQGAVFVNPKVTFKVFLPEDPAIRKVVFLDPSPTKDGGFKLKKLGTIDLGDK